MLMPVNTIPPKKWTVLLYSAADNNLHPYMVDDVAELETVGSDAQTDVVVQIDHGREGGGAERLKVEKFVRDQENPHGPVQSPVLEKMGHSVQHVADGRLAVEAVKAARAGDRPDLVLMDLHMPVMDGLDAIALIRKFEEEKGLPALPIMVLSADSQESTRHTVLAHGATGFVTKPLDPQALLEAVQHQVAA